MQKVLSLVVLVVAIAVSAPASATPPSTRWTTTASPARADQLVPLDVTRTRDGYHAVLHETVDPFRVQWTAIPCPGNGSLQAGSTLLELIRRDDGTFTVTFFKARLYPVGPDGMGTEPATQCLFDTVHYIGRFVDRATAAAADPDQVALYPRDHDSFLVLGRPSEPCPVPDDRKYTCGSPWPATKIIDAPLVDTDEDGLPDEWELKGLTVNGVKLDLPAMGADPDHKDLFVQMDAASGAAYDDATLAFLISDLQRVPIANPDGHPGITLHLDAGPNTIMDPVHSTRWGSKSRGDRALTGIADHFSGFPANAECPDGVQPFEAPFAEVRDHHLDALRAPAFRYVLVVMYIGPRTDCITGANWTIPSKSFLIASWDAHGMRPMEHLEGTFLHELGHSIALHHGGDNDADNYKPNYQSVMNYAYQNAGIWSTDQTNGYGTYAYSNRDPSSANEIDERALDEHTGFQTDPLPGTRFTYRCPTSGFLTAVPRQQTNLDCDSTTTRSAPIDITPTNRQAAKVLTTYNDITHLHLKPEVGGAGAAGARGEPETLTLAQTYADLAVLNNDRQDPTVRITLRKQKKKRTLTLKAHDDVGLTTATVTVGTTQQVVRLSQNHKIKKDVTRTIDIDPTGDVGVVVVDVAGKAATATSK